MARTHGTLSCYKGGCRRTECRQAEREYDREYQRRRAYGRPTTDLVDAEEARAHARRLLDLGWERRALSAAVGSEIDYLLYGSPARGLPPLRRTSALTSRRILAIPAELIATDKRIPADGSRRRARGLCLLGHTIAWQCQQTGLNRAIISRLINNISRQIVARHAVAIRDLHEQYWNTPAPDTGAARAIRRTAQTRGYLPTGAYDDDLLDVPDEQMWAEVRRRAAAMDTAALSRARYARQQQGDRSPLIIAADQEYGRRQRANAAA